MSPLAQQNQSDSDEQRRQALRVALSGSLPLSRPGGAPQTVLSAPAPAPGDENASNKSSLPTLSPSGASATLGTAPNPDETRRQQLMQRLAGGAAPTQTPQPEQFPTPAATPASQDNTPANTTTPPAAKPLSVAMPQIMSREAFGAQYKDPVPSFQEPSFKNRLMHGLFFGMQEFGRPGEGAKAEQEWEDRLNQQRQMATPLARQQRADEEYKNYVAGQTAEAKATQEVAAANKAMNPTERQEYPTIDQMAGRMVQQAVDSGDPRRVELAIDMGLRMTGRGSLTSLTGPEKNFYLVHLNDPALTGPDGNIDMAKLDAAFRQEQQKATKESSLKPEIVNQIGPEPDPRQYSKGQQDPEYQKAAKEWGESYQKKLQEETAAQGAARGAAFMANRMYSAIDTTQGNRPVYVSGETLKNDTQGRYLTPAGGKEITKEMVVQDIRGSVENVRESLIAMKGGGFDPAARAALAASLADPNGTAAQFFQAIPRGSMLDETQQQYVIDLFQLREQAMNLRMVTGMGQGSDQLRRAIVSTLPGAATPDANYANRQLDAIEQVLNRVEKGVANVPLKPAQGPETHGPLVHPATGQAFHEGDTRTNRRTGEVQIFRGGQWQTQQPKQ